LLPLGGWHASRTEDDAALPSECDFAWGCGCHGRGRFSGGIPANVAVHGVLFPASEGGRINIDNFRAREWLPALKAAGIEHRRIYDLRHTFATWSLAAGMSIFTLARRMGTSVQMIDATYGHMAHDSGDQDRGLLNAYDGHNGATGQAVGTNRDDLDACEESKA
jgi:hypothetical protein